MARMARRTAPGPDQGSLLPTVARDLTKALGPGPVYQGVGKTIRTLTKVSPDGEPPRVDARRMAGVIAQARSLARAIDRASGHNVSGWQERGSDLAQLHAQLQEVLERLDPDLAGEDPMLQLLEEMETAARASGAAESGGGPRGGAEESHRPE